MTKWIFAVMVAAAAALPVYAQNPARTSAQVATQTPTDAEATIKAALKQRFTTRFPDYSIGSISATPLAGIYEISVQGELLYADASGRYLFQGALIDLDTRTDLTAQRMEQLNRIDFNALPLHAAITQVRGNGQRKIAIFEDPNCGYCKQFHRTLEGFDDITIHSLMYPVLAPDSRAKSEAILCAPDAVAALRGWMLQARLPAPANPQTCTTHIDTVLAFGSQQNLRGTPAIFFEDGSHVAGALNAEQLKLRLAEQN